MKQSQLFIRTLLISLLLISMPMAMSGTKNDSPILEKIYEYHDAHISEIHDLQDNVYAKFRFNVERRNVILWLIPSMYVLAKDPREYIRESYNDVTFKNEHDFNVNRLRLPCPGDSHSSCACAR